MAPSSSLLAVPSYSWCCCLCGGVITKCVAADGRISPPKKANEPDKQPDLLSSVGTSRFEVHCPQPKQIGRCRYIDLGSTMYIPM